MLAVLRKREGPRHEGKRTYKWQGFNLVEPKIPILKCNKSILFPAENFFFNLKPSLNVFFFFLQETKLSCGAPAVYNFFPHYIG